MDKTKFHGIELYIKNAPAAYEPTPQQIRMREIARSCGIRKGMGKAALMTAMKECVGPAMRKENHG